MADLSSLPIDQVAIDCQEDRGSLELWRHALGHGGINPLPLPMRVVEGARKLGPRLIRIFLQEFFRIYPGGGRFDWSRLDPYMAALAATGAKVVAAITCKPQALFPEVDHARWRPRDPGAWQQLIAQLVRRYSVETPLVTHWEIGNEVDIGESGGSPYLIPDPRDYGEYYAMTIRPILETFPGARVGGPANAGLRNEPLPGFIHYCRQSGARLDFLSWHLYHSDPRQHAGQVEQARSLLAGFPGPRPELMVTEFSPGFPPVSVEDQAFAPRRAAAVAAILLELLDAGLDWSFHYHLWDQVCFPEDFAPFFSPAGVANMVRHWNEVPHRFGLFGVGGEVRPQYFVYQMLGRLGSRRLAAAVERGEVRALAGRDGERIGALVVNYSPAAAGDRVVSLRFAGLQPGARQLTVYRIDGQRRWNAAALELEPLECRAVCVLHQWECQVMLPADGVALVCLHPAEVGGGR